MAKLRYETVAEFDAAIDEYFKSCQGHFLTDENGEKIKDKNGVPIIIDARPPTMTGLALHLGFASRRGMLEYKYKKAFLPSYSRARALCEKYAEERLYDREGNRGAQFALEYAFGWKKEAEEAQKESGGVMIVDDL